MSPTPERDAALERSDSYTNPYLAGALLGVLLFLSFALTGHGLGASGGMNRMLVFFEDLFRPEHIDRTSYLLGMAGGDTNALDHWVVFLAIGTLLGGWLSGRKHGRLVLETIHGPRIGPRTRWVAALAGGILMGYGARFARGCTSGQALSGGAVLSAGSWAFMIAVFAGGYALAYFFRRFWT